MATTALSQQELARYANDLLDDEDLVYGDIYAITNKVNGKKYVGQTRTHVFSRNRFRPYGYQRRFKAHLVDILSERSACTALATAVREFGQKNFEVTLLTRCTADQKDELEAKYISDLNTLAPNGYNLASGGRAGSSVPNRTFQYGPSTESDTLANAENLRGHYKAEKLEKFKDVGFDFDTPDEYIETLRDTGTVAVARLRFNDIKTDFYGKNIEEARDYAKDFLRELRVFQLELNDGDLPPPERTERYAYGQGHSQSLKEYLAAPEARAQRAESAQKQHWDKKFDKFKDVALDFENPEQYLKERSDHGRPYCRVATKGRNNTFVNFFGKDLEDARNRAKQFLRDLKIFRETE